jgi:CHAT domain-containing protein
VARLRRAVDRRAPLDQAQPPVESLFETVLRPVVKWLPDGAPLVVIPDGPLHLVPFAALRDGSRARYLVEDHSIVVSPSLRVGQRAHRLRAALAPARHPAALVVGAPAVSAERGTPLPILRAAAQEIAELVRLYPRARRLEGREATRERFLAELAKADVVHFAGHALANPEYPLLSRLLLAPDAKSRATGAVLAREINSLHLPRTRLVVLAACSTAAGQTRRGEGALSLARPFLVAGVPSVVGTLWDIDDEVAGEIFVEFHRGVRESGDVAKALQAAQVMALRGVHGAHSLQWSGVVVFGAG